ncbi:hypothetical protein ACJX0J_014292, partial [Zea mays]
NEQNIMQDCNIDNDIELDATELHNFGALNLKKKNIDTISGPRNNTANVFNGLENLSFDILILVRLQHATVRGRL